MELMMFFIKTPQGLFIQSWGQAIDVWTNTVKPSESSHIIIYSIYLYTNAIVCVVFI